MPSSAIEKHDCHKITDQTIHDLKAIDCHELILENITDLDVESIRWLRQLTKPQSVTFPNIKDLSPTVALELEMCIRDRLYPQRRIGPKGSGKFERISWETALDEISSRLQEILKTHGPQSVLPYCYCGTMGVIESQHPLAFFRALGALELDWSICAATGSAAWEANYGPFKLGVDPEEASKSRFIILWGINALRSNSHFAPWRCV